MEPPRRFLLPARRNPSVIVRAVVGCLYRQRGGMESGAAQPLPTQPKNRSHNLRRLCKMKC
jgi:hypothetical protein